MHEIQFLIWKKVQDYVINWIRYVNRMPRNRLPRIIKKLHTKEQKEPGK